MSEVAESPPLANFRRETLDLYFAVIVLMLIGIGVLIVYSIRLGSLVGPGVEQSFGIALALMFIQAAVIFHVVDRTYRSWPLGRKVAAREPKPITDQSTATFVKVVILVIAAAAIAYILGSLIGTW
ncbi:MAG: hypothetical protein WAN87_00335 [Thermoplasmata archaeon]